LGNVSNDELKKKYDEIYNKEKVKGAFPGIHSVILHTICDLLPNKLILDIGCGCGRLSIMCASMGAERVIGFDYAERAIKIANLILQCSGLRNVTFHVGDVAQVLSREDLKFDIVIMSEVIEHLQNPLEVLTKIKGLLKEGGWLVVSCPNFSNFRGYVYNTLLTLFRLPMSLTDVRQVDFKQISEWCEEAGYSIERVVGTLYELGWTEEAFVDLRKRIPLAVRDSNTLEDEICNYKQLERFLEERAKENEQFLNYLVSSNLLRKIRREKVKLERLESISGELWEKIIAYMSDNEGMKNAFYTDKAPFNLSGAGCIYLLRQKRKVENAKESGK
jgi:ubiquinone biosynthesis O-methyltransferase